MVRKDAGTKPVACPVAGCQISGIRSKMNFCQEHFVSLSEAERARLRDEQRRLHLAERRAQGVPVPHESNGTTLKRSFKKLPAALTAEA